jgi:hypothetical protein
MLHGKNGGKLQAARCKPKAESQIQRKAKSFRQKPKAEGKYKYCGMVRTASRKPKAKSKYNTAASFTLPFTIDPGAPEKLTNV